MLFRKAYTLHKSFLYFMVSVASAGVVGWEHAQWVHKNTTSRRIASRHTRLSFRFGGSTLPLRTGPKYCYKMHVRKDDLLQ
jgi:hypothetical protein